MTILNTANKVYVGTALASAVYAGSNKVWPSFDAYTKLVLHGDGPDGSTVIADATGLHGNANIFGGCRISSTQSKFGGTSIFFDGTGCLEFPNHSDWDLGAGDFTFDWWENSSVAGSYWTFARNRETTWVPYIMGQIGIYLTSNMAAWDLGPGHIFGSSTANAWIHLALTRNGTTFRSFQNGVLGAVWSAAGSVAVVDLPFCIGSAQFRYFYGYVDEFRLSKGIARWTANFTPPTGPY